MSSLWVRYLLQLHEEALDFFVTLTLLHSQRARDVVPWPPLQPVHSQKRRHAELRSGLKAKYDPQILKSPLRLLLLIDLIASSM